MQRSILRGDTLIETGNTIKVNQIKNSAINYADLNGFADLTEDDIVLGKIQQMANTRGNTGYR